MKKLLLDQSEVFSADDAVPITIMVLIDSFESSTHVMAHFQRVDYFPSVVNGLIDTGAIRLHTYESAVSKLFLPVPTIDAEATTATTTNLVLSRFLRMCLVHLARPGLLCRPN